MTTTVRGSIKGQYNTIAEAKADHTLKVGQIAKTAGYYAVGDGGGAEYVVVAGGTGTTDGGAYHELANGLELQLLVAGSVKLSQIGGVLNTAATPFPHVVVDRDTNKTGTYSIQEGQTIELQADIIQDDDLPCLLAQHSNWHLVGNGIIRRAAGQPTTLVTGSIGLSVESSAMLYRITGNISFKYFGDAGLAMDGGSIITGLVGRNTVSDIVCANNWVGFKLLDGFPAEYTSFASCFSTDNVSTGVLLETGNINWSGGTIAGNGGGVHLRHPTAGGNPQHGIFSGTNINHNTDYAVWAEKVAAGHTFSGCHFYNNADQANGRIILDNCRGINIDTGILSTVVEYIDDGHVHVGYNRIANMRCENNAGIEPTGGNFDRSKLYVEDNFKFDGRWIENDTANINFLRWEGSGTASLTGATEFNLTELIGSIQEDNRGLFDSTNLTMPYLVNLDVSVGFDISMNALMVGGETLFIERDTQGDDVWQLLRNVNLQPLTNPDKTRFSVDVSVPFQFGSGSKLRVRLVGMTPSTTYTFAPGAYIACRTQR